MKKIDWKSPGSESSKRELIGKDWGSEVDTYLWYEIDDINNLSDAEVAAIVVEFFTSGKAGFGDVELHRSSQLPNGPTLLRLRGKLKLRPSLMLRGRYCPLYQVGHGGSFVGSPSEDCLNFYNRWELGKES